MANIELPKDADGREIPLDTSEMFIADGTMVHVVKFEYIYYTCDASGLWFVYFNRTSGEHMTLQPCDVYLTPPDSWEKLENDLGKIANNPGEVVCAYFDRERKDCDGCKLESCECACSYALLRDVIERIRKLRGED